MKRNFGKKNKQHLKSLYQSQRAVLAEAVGITKRYLQDPISITVLQDVDFVVREGEIIAVVGPSGCGKSTLLNCMAGIDEVDSGTVYFDEKDLSSLTDNERTKIRAQETGFIFQNFNLIPVLSAVENVELPMLAIGEKAKLARERAIQLLEEVGLGEKINNKPNELSGGEKQRVAIARALINEPKVVWADEPTGNLDSTNAQSIMSLIMDLNKKKETTFVIVTHDVSIAMKAHRIVRMDSGKIVS